MLNYTSKYINSIFLIITTIICVILFITLDLCVFKIQEENKNANIYQSSIKMQKNYNLKRKNMKDIIDLKNSFLEIMQIADIYDENTKIDEIGDLNNKEDRENPGTEDNTLHLKEEYKWKIEIPKISLKAPIKSGTSQNVLAIAVGHFEETPKWNGNIALAGHNRGYNCNFFQNIKYLENGDEINYYTEDGKRKYKVILNKIIKQTDWSYIQNTKDNRVTLITCVENMFEYRRCIQAIEII